MRRIAVRGIVVHEGKLLCVRLKPYNDIAASGGEWWCLPGGTVEDGEVLEKALVREMQEETGVTPKHGRLLYIQQFMFNGKEHLELFFYIENPLDFLSVDLSQTSHGNKEIEHIDFVDPADTDIRPSFLTHEPITTHIASGAPVKFFSLLP